MRYVEKELSQEQKEELKGYVLLSTSIVRILMFIIFVVGLSLLLQKMQHILLISKIDWWLIPTFVLSIYIIIYSKSWTGGQEFRQKVKDDLRQGQVKISIIDVDLVIEIKEEEDEGPSFIVVTKDGEKILLTGQDLYKYTDKQFPWSQFEVLEAPYSKVFFGLKQLGKPIVVNNRLPPFTYEQAKSLGCFEKDYIVLDDALLKQANINLEI